MIISREQKEAEEQRQFELNSRKKEKQGRYSPLYFSSFFSESRGIKSFGEIYLV